MRFFEVIYDSKTNEVVDINVKLEEINKTLDNYSVSCEWNNLSPVKNNPNKLNYSQEYIGSLSSKTFDGGISTRIWEELVHLFQSEQQDTEKYKISITFNTYKYQMNIETIFKNK